jgi:hypothetical protein
MRIGADRSGKDKGGKGKVRESQGLEKPGTERQMPIRLLKNGKRCGIEGAEMIV